MKTMYLSIKDYIGCPKRNVQDFGKVFLMLNYTYIISSTQTYISTIYVFYSMAACFDEMLVIFRPQHLLYQMICPLWDPIVFTCGLLTYLLELLDKLITTELLLFVGCVYARNHYSIKLLPI